MADDDVTWTLGPAIAQVVIARLGTEGYQTRLAELLGCSAASVNPTLRGKHPISERTIRTYAQALGMAPLDLLAEGIRLVRAEANGDAPERIVERDGEEDGEAIAPRPLRRTGGGSLPKINPRRAPEPAAARTRISTRPHTLPRAPPRAAARPSAKASKAAPAPKGKKAPRASTRTRA